MNIEFAGADTGGRQFARILHVGGKKYVEGRAIADLREEVAGGSVGDLQFDCRVDRAKLARDFRQREVQVRGGGDRQLL